MLDNFALLQIRVAGSTDPDYLELELPRLNDLSQDPCDWVVVLIVLTLGKQ